MENWRLPGAIFIFGLIYSHDIPHTLISGVFKIQNARLAQIAKSQPPTGEGEKS